MLKSKYPMMTPDQVTLLTNYKRTYTRLLVAFLKAKHEGHTPVGYENLVIEVNNMERDLPPSIAFTARKQIDMIWDPSIREAYEGSDKRRAG